MKKIYIQPQTTVERITPTELLSASNTTLTLRIDESIEASADEQMSRSSIWDDDWDEE